MTELSRYRRRPDPAEAVHFNDPSAGQEIARLFGGRLDSSARAGNPSDMFYELLLPSLEGELRAHIGDWVVRNLADGTLDVCTDKAFHELYEEDK